MDCPVNHVCWNYQAPEWVPALAFGLIVMFAAAFVLIVWLDSRRG